MLNQRFVDLAAQCPGPLVIEAELPLAEALHRQVNQGICGATIPAQHRVAPFRSDSGRQQGEIGDTAKVQQGSPAADAPNQGRISGRHKGSTLAPQGQIGTAEIKDHRPTQQLGEQRTLQQLPAQALPLGRWRAVPNGLAVTPHQLALPPRVAGPGRLRLRFGDRFREIQQVGGRKGLALTDCHQAALQIWGVGGGGRGQDAPLGAVGAA